jgi:Kdo2-lipid IVA lauroyltransferase/acyltransferase
MATKNKFGYFLEYVFALSFFGLLRALPESWSAAFGRALGRTAGRIVSSRSRMAAANMRNAFPEAPENQIRTWVGKCWENLGQSLSEFAHIPFLSSEEYFKRVDVEGLEFMKESHARGKGVLLFTAHYANWELTTQFIVFSGLPLAVIARRMKNPFVNDFISRLRSRLNITVFMHKNAVRESIRWLKQGKVLGLLIDQRITDGGVKVPFFGRDAHTTTMPALLALRLGCPVHPVHCWRENGRIKIRVSPAMNVSGLSTKEEDIVEFTARMTSVVEQWARERPPMWLWIHDRWK